MVRENVKFEKQFVTIVPSDEVEGLWRHVAPGAVVDRLETEAG